MNRGEIFDSYESESPLATELRRLYHNIKTGENASKDRAFLVTSSNRAEGKSTIVSHLAITIAQFPRQKVLVVDADLRRPNIHGLFGVENSRGLVDCLSTFEDPMNMVKDTRLDNLKVIPSGAPCSSPAELFESEALSEFFNKVKFYFDIVLVDAAPVLAVSDVLFLSSEVDAVLFVILAGVTPRQVAIRAKEILVDSRAKIAGIVVNNAMEVLPYYYSYKYYGYRQERAR